MLRECKARGTRRPEDGEGSRDGHASGEQCHGPRREEGFQEEGTEHQEPAASEVRDREREV